MTRGLGTNAAKRPTNSMVDPERMPRRVSTLRMHPFSTMIRVTGVHAKVCSLPLVTASLTRSPATASDQGMTRSASEFHIALWVVNLLQSGIDQLAKVRDFEVQNR
ncbi:MAG: hypothetical protein P8P91_00665 [Pseudomonadales bacterium]|nr:hypothetical protein [Pseudomonadales bacterium]